MVCSVYYRGCAEGLSNVIITEFIFDDANEEEFARHGLWPFTVFQLLDNPHVVGPNPRQDIHTATHLFVGRDNGGAPITVPIEPTSEPTVWRPVTAWRADESEITELDKRGK